MKHTLIMQIDSSDNLSSKDLAEWIESTLKICQVFFHNKGEVYQIEVKPEERQQKRLFGFGRKE